MQAQQRIQVKARSKLASFAKFAGVFCLIASLGALDNCNWKLQQTKREQTYSAKNSTRWCFVDLPKVKGNNGKTRWAIKPTNGRKLVSAKTLARFKISKCTIWTNKLLQERQRERSYERGPNFGAQATSQASACEIAISIINGQQEDLINSHGARMLTAQSRLDQHSKDIKIQMDATPWKFMSDSKSERGKQQTKFINGPTAGPDELTNRQTRFTGYEDSVEIDTSTDGTNLSNTDIRAKHVAIKKALAKEEARKEFLSMTENSRQKNTAKFFYEKLQQRARRQRTAANITAAAVDASKRRQRLLQKALENSRVKDAMPNLNETETNATKNFGKVTKTAKSKTGMLQTNRSMASKGEEYSHSAMLAKSKKSNEHQQQNSSKIESWLGSQPRDKTERPGTEATSVGGRTAAGNTKYEGTRPVHSWYNNGASDEKRSAKRDSESLSKGGIKRNKQRDGLTDKEAAAKLAGKQSRRNEKQKDNNNHANPAMAIFDDKNKGTGKQPPNKDGVDEDKKENPHNERLDGKNDSKLTDQPDKKGGNDHKNNKNKKEPSIKPIDGLTEAENQQYAYLCRKLERTVRLNNTVKQAILLDDAQWTWDGESYEVQATAFIHAQALKWQWALKQGRPAEQAVIKHIISKIVPTKLKLMVIQAMQSQSSAMGTYTTPYPHTDIEVLADVVIQAAALLDSAYAKQINAENRTYKWYAVTRDGKWGVYDKWQDVCKMEPWTWEDDEYYKGFDLHHDACEWLDAQDPYSHNYKPLKQKTLPTMQQPSWQNTTTAFVPAPYPSKKEISEMNESSSSDEDEEDKIPAEVLADIIDQMHPRVRQETLQLINKEAQRQAEKRAVSNYSSNVLNTHARAQRPAMSTRGLTREQRKRKKQLDRIIQKDLLRRIRKWDKAVAKARAEEKRRIQSQQLNNQKHSPGKQSMESAFSLKDAKSMEQQKMRQVNEYNNQQHAKRTAGIQQQTTKDELNTSKSNNDGGQFLGVKPGNKNRAGGSSPPLIKRVHAYYAVIKDGCPMIITNGDKATGAGYELEAIFQKKQAAMKWLSEFDNGSKKSHNGNQDQSHDMSMVNSVSTIPPHANSNNWRTPQPVQQQQQEKDPESDDNNQNPNTNGWEALTPMQRQLLRETKIAKGSIQPESQQQLINRLNSSNMTTGPTFHQVAPTAKQEPKCSMLKTTGEEAMARWRNDLEDWNHRVERYRQAHPWYVPTLSDWVAPHVWKRISEDMLHSEDKTSGGPPNDIMVEALLRREGKYASSDDESGKVLYAEPMEQLQAIKWELKRTHVEGYEAFMAKWSQLMRTMYERQKPPARKQAKIMRKAVRPLSLSKRIKNKSWDGLGPHKLSKEFQQWRLDAKEDPILMRQLIRENANYWDRMGMLPNTSGDANKHNKQPAPKCKAVGCNNDATARIVGGGYFTYCSKHKHLSSAPPKRVTTTTKTSTTGTNPSAERPKATTPTTAPKTAVPPATTEVTSTTEHNSSIFTEPGAADIDVGTCVLATCDNKRQIRPDGKITLACSGACYNEWDNQGKPFPLRPCQLCGGRHGVLRCPQITEERKTEMVDKLGYEHAYSWWHYVNNIAKARNYIQSIAAPQRVQKLARSAEDSTHGDARIGPLNRRVYFDLGGEYDLIDDKHYEMLREEIQAGNIRGAKLLKPQELGFSHRGVPIDLACATGSGESSVSWIKDWMQITVRITTDSGRRFILSNLCIGVVKRTTPLLILGKRTCALCGYKTVRQQDKDRRDESDKDNAQLKKAKRWAMDQTRTEWHEPTTLTKEKSNSSKQQTRSKVLNIPVRHEGEMHRAKAQFQQIAACDIPLQCVYENEQQNDSHKSENNKKEHGGKHSWSENRNRRGWKRDQWKHQQSACKHHEQDNGNTVEHTMPTLQAKGKTMRGDTEDNDKDDGSQEDDDEEGPHSNAPPNVMQDPAGWMGSANKRNTFELDFVFEEDDDDAYAQYMNIASSEEPLQEVNTKGEDVPSRGALLTDGYMFAGKRALKDMESCGFIVTDRLAGSYITTAALRRSGCHPEQTSKEAEDMTESPDMQALKEQPDLHQWIRGEKEPHSTMLHGQSIIIDQVKVTHPYRRTALVDNQTFTVIASNDMCVIMGCKMAKTVDTILDNDESPLQMTNPRSISSEIQEQLRQLQQDVNDNEEVSDKAKQQVHDMLQHRYADTWRTKYDLQQPAEFPPMEIRLKEGAKPQKIKRHYRWTKEQRRFLRGLLRKLVDVGVISRVDSEWCCPVVLVIKPDLTWRLCVDPTALNKATIGMVWDVPKVRELIQEELHGMKWLCRFDFTAMFWQIPLAEQSRRLFSFYAGSMGSFQFNRVAMGALNSSIYTQRMVAQMFSNAKRTDNGKPLLGNGLIAQTDDILLYARSEKEMLELLELFFHTIACHKMKLSPSKCRLFVKQTIYCGLKITREGIEVDPERVNGLINLPAPENIGDVWQFNAATGWIRDEIPLFSEASTKLTDLITASLKGHKKRNMKAARKISLEKAGWTSMHQGAWDTIHKSLLTTIRTSFRDRRKKACLFTDASSTGWAYVITQCDPEELNKPWHLQKHEILAVNSGKFRNSQRFWAMPCKEAYPIRRAVERHKYLLAGNMPFASINDHKSLTYVFDEPSRVSVVSVAARDRLRRWAEYLRSYTFDTTHIPGACNHFCDLLSRNGCKEPVEQWKQSKASQAGTTDIAHPQMAIIEPTNMPKGDSRGHRDLDIRGDDLMPTVSVDEWPTPERLRQAQQEGRVQSDKMDESNAVPLHVNATNKIILPVDHDTTMEIIAICHQGDHAHRSAANTLKEFRNTFTLKGLNRTEEERYIKACCRKCLSCLKTRAGKVIPRPLWYMVYASRPFEYIHMDFIELPDATDGNVYVLMLTCDFSLTTMLIPTPNADAETVVDALMEYLAVYPDPDLIHTDGGSHFRNEVMRELTRRRGYKHTICTPHTSWAHGVAERNNKAFLQVLRPLCLKLGLEGNQWPQVLKLVQSTMNRMKRPSRGNMSPIELTTGIQPRTTASMIHKGAGVVDVLDEDATKALQQYTRKFAKLMQGIYERANKMRRAKSDRNRSLKEDRPIPEIEVGDFVLYAKHKKDTKLDYTWLGPAVVMDVPTPMIYTIRPYTMYESQPFDVHMSRVRRFASKDLRMTQQLRLSVKQDHPDNVVQQIVSHEMHNDVLYMMCRWRGFTKELDSAQRADSLAESCPAKVREYFNKEKTVKDKHITEFMKEHFPSLQHEEQVRSQEAQTGIIVKGKRKQNTRRGRTYAQATQQQRENVRTTSARRNTNKKSKPMRHETSNVATANTKAQQTNARDARAIRRNQLKEHSTGQKLNHPTASTEQRKTSTSTAYTETDSSNDDSDQTPSEHDINSSGSSNYPHAGHQTSAGDTDDPANAMTRESDDEEKNDRTSATSECNDTSSSMDMSNTSTNESSADDSITELGTLQDLIHSEDDSEVYDSIDDTSWESIDKTIPTQRLRQQIAEINDNISEPEMWSNKEAEVLGHTNIARSSNSVQHVEPSTKMQRRQPGYALKTEVRQSTIHGAGKGLFMLEPARKGDRVAVYVGKLMTAEQAESANSDYIVKIHSNLYLDAKDVLNDNKGRYVNHAGPGYTNNARLGSGRSPAICKATGRPWISIIATKNIEPQEEVFMPYGRGWVWPWQKRAQKAAHQHMMTTATIQKGAQRTQENGNAGKACTNIRSALESMVNTAVKMGSHSKRTVQALWNTAVHWAMKDYKQKSMQAVMKLTRLIQQMQNSQDEGNQSAHIPKPQQQHGHYNRRGRGRGRGYSRGGRGRGRSFRQPPKCTHTVKLNSQQSEMSESSTKSRPVMMTKTADAAWNKRHAPEITRHPIFQHLPCGRAAITQEGTITGKQIQDCMFIVSESIGENFATRAACKAHIQRPLTASDEGHIEYLNIDKYLAQWISNSEYAIDEKQAHLANMRGLNIQMKGKKDVTINQLRMIVIPGNTRRIILSPYTALEISSRQKGDCAGYDNFEKWHMDESNQRIKTTENANKQTTGNRQMEPKARQQLGVATPRATTSKKLRNDRNTKALTNSKITQQLGVEQHNQRSLQRAKLLKMSKGKNGRQPQEIEFIDEGHELVRLTIDSSDSEDEIGAESTANSNTAQAMGHKAKSQQDYNVSTRPDKALKRRANQKLRAHPGGEKDQQPTKRDNDDKSKHSQKDKDNKNSCGDMHNTPKKQNVSGDDNNSNEQEKQRNNQPSDGNPEAPEEDEQWERQNEIESRHVMFRAIMATYIVAHKNSSCQMEDEMAYRSERQHLPQKARNQRRLTAMSRLVHALGAGSIITAHQ